MPDPVVAQAKFPSLAVLSISRHALPAGRFTRTPRHVRPRYIPAPSPAPRPDREEALIVGLLPLVHRQARAINRSLPVQAGVELGDLVGSGVIGLVQAVRRFDARKGADVERYVSFRIRGAILDELRGLDTTSRSNRKMLRQVEQARLELQAKRGGPVSGLEVAETLGIKPDRWQRAVRYHQAVGTGGQSLSPSANSGDVDPTYPTEVARDSESPFEVCFRRERATILEKALGALPQREREIILLYYERNLTQKHIGARFNVCEARVSQLRDAALNRLRTTLLRMVGSPRNLL